MRAKRWLTAVAALFTHRWLPWPLIVMWLVIVVGSLAGCSTAELDKSIAEQKQAQALDEKAAAKIDEEIAALKVARDAIAVELQKARDEARDTAAIEKRLAEAEKEAATKSAIAAELAKDAAIKAGVIAALERQRETAGDPASQIGAGIQTGSNFLPEPWRSLLSIVGGAVVAAAGTRQIVRKPLVQQLDAREELIGNISVAKAAGKVTIETSHALAMKQLMSDAAQAELKKIEGDAAWAAEIAKAKQTAITHPRGAEAD